MIYAIHRASRGPAPSHVGAGAMVWRTEAEVRSYLGGLKANMGIAYRILEVDADWAHDTRETLEHVSWGGLTRSADVVREVPCRG